MSLQVATVEPRTSAAQQFLASPDKKMLIGPHWVNAASGETIAAINPATGEQLGTIPAGDSADIDRAVAVARKAFSEGEWAQTTPAQRTMLLWKLADLVEENFEELAELEVMDQGKTIHVSRVEIQVVVDQFRFFAGQAQRIEGETITPSINYQPAGREMLCYTRKEAIGVVGAIVPWNSPLIMASFKLAPALACGCTLVLKPAEDTSLTTLRLGELILEAGFPPGVVNIVTGVGEKAGAALAAHPDVDKIAFTGSTGTGRAILDGAKSNLKKVALELGGKSPAIFLEDCDMDLAIPGAANMITWNNGEICVAGSRLYAHKSIFDKLVTGVAEAMGGLKLGNGLDESTQLGPMVSRIHSDRVASYIEEGTSGGAELVIGGGQLGDHKTFIEPTIMVNTKSEMRCVQEEIFGPVLVCQPFSDESEIPSLANDTVYGLSASVWTESIAKAHQLSNAIRSGTIWINCHLMFDVALPIGGYKQSGWSRDSGQQAVENYLETKTVIAVA